MWWKHCKHQTKLYLLALEFGEKKINLILMILRLTPQANEGLVHELAYITLISSFDTLM